MKWIGLGLVCLIVLIAGFGYYNTTIVNPRVLATIQNEPEGERAGIVMVLQFENGKIIPVNYLREGNLVFVGADGPWWREFPTTREASQGAPVRLTIRGKTYQGFAKTELDDQAYVDEVFARLRPKAPDWLPDWLNGKLVVIEVLDAP
jgi:hypothetical protein